jgi:hypothetical protein
VAYDKNVTEPTLVVLVIAVVVRDTAELKVTPPTEVVLVIAVGDTETSVPVETVGA